MYKKVELPKQINLNKKRSFELPEVAKSNDYKFRDGIVCYKSSVFTGGNVVGYNGFLRIKKGQAAS